MRNVRSALLAAVVGLSLTTACSFSSSRSWGSASTPNSGSQSRGKPALQHTSKGKPAQHHSSNGKPARKTPAPAPAPAPTPTPTPSATPEPAAAPAVPARMPRDEAPTRVPRDEAPTRVPRDEAPTRVPRDEAPTRVPRDEAPTRVPREGTSTSSTVGTASARLGTKPAEQPAKPITGVKARTKQAPKGLSVAPAQPDPPARGIKAAPNQ